MKNQKSTKPRKPRAHTGKRDSHYDSPLRILRGKYDLTLAQLSELTGIPASLLSHIERGNSAKIGVFETLADFFGVCVDGLIRNDVRMTLASMTMDDKKMSTCESLVDIINANSKKKGKKGETFVVGLERKELEGTPYAKGVTDAPSRETNAHFDVLSFTREGEKRHIEVKTTSYACDTDFFLSNHEFEFLLMCVKTGKNYELHRVYYVNDPDRANRRIYSAQEVLDKFDFVPWSFRVKIKEEIA